MSPTTAPATAAAPTSGGPGAARRVAVAVITDGLLALTVLRRRAEKDLAWQFPAGKIEPGITVTAVASLGERVHPTTGVHLSYIACTLAPDSGPASLASPQEISGVAWIEHAKLPGLFDSDIYEPVLRHLGLTPKAGKP
ncbi:NUDIX hydrolase [Streptomyces sp. NPDC059816]|uniref:NUDIX hydrolase n=1 Tax=Streptomyces sp. NPDC059816 TaxID=3346960 RepID=UPI00364D7982